MPYLLVIYGKAKGVRFGMNRKKITIGQDKSNTISFKDPNLSSHQYSLVRTEKGYFIRDITSDQGVKINGHLQKEALLKHGDIVSIGNADFIYCTKEIEPVKKRITVGPPLFKPEPSYALFYSRFIWPFSLSGRAGRCLLLASKHPTESKRIRKVEKVLEKLLAKNIGGKPATDQLIADLIVFLAWNRLSRREFTKSAASIALLDSMYPSLAARTALRWDLMKALWIEGKTEQYAQQAKLFLADPGASDQTYTQAVLDIVQRLYTQVSPEMCANAITSACQPLQERPQMQWAYHLCHCPSFFKTGDEGREWMERIKAKGLHFSNLMEADAHLVAARAAEVNGEWEVMIEAALNALRSAPAYNSGLYWLTRAKLYIDGSRPLEHVISNFGRGEDRWDRIRLLDQLHEHPSVANALPIIQLLEGRMGNVDRFESLLAVDVIRRALKATPPSTPEDIAKTAQICGIIEKTVGELPWTQVLIAHKEARIDHLYAPAYKRLEKPEVCDAPGAMHIARISRILAGSPLKPQKDSLEDAVTILEVVMWHIMGAPKDEMTFDWSLLREKLILIREDEIFRQFPDLKQAANILQLTLGLLDGDAAGVWEQLPLIELSSTVPGWILWLYARTCLLVKDICGPLEPMTTIGFEYPAAAWFAECWIVNQCFGGLIDVDKMSELATDLEEWSQYQGEMSGVIQQIRRARKTCYRQFDNLFQSFSVDSVFPELGELSDSVCATELSLEMKYANARRILASGNAQEAIESFESLRNDLININPITAVWWTPLTCYWLGVAQAHSEATGATTSLEMLVNGPRGMSAKGQLALLALKEQNIEEALRWIEDVPLCVPSVRYAKAVILIRSHDPEGARQLLDSEEAHRILGETPYALAAKRLLAAVEERFGNKEESVRLNNDILEQHSGDVITTVRLGRNLLRTLYEQFRTNRTVDPQTIQNRLGDFVSTVNTPIQWWKSYDLLFRLMTSPDNALANLQKLIQADDNISAQSLLWRQLMISRLLQAGFPSKAFRMADIEDLNSSCQWFEKTRSILKSWFALTSLAENPHVQKSHKKSASRDSIQALRGCVQIFRAMTDSNQNSVISLWRFLSEYGFSLANNEDPPKSETCEGANSSPMFHVVRLWSNDPQQRTDAARKLQSVINNDGIAWSEPQKLLISCLTARELAIEDEHVKQYEYLEPILDELPVSGVEMWLSASRIRLERKDWKSLLESELPDCVADLSNPQVRLIIGLAYTIAAADDCVKGNMRAALQKIRQAQDNLEALIGNE